MIPKISVLLPAYNSEKYLEASIDSILSQTFTDFELILVDDGSKDTSPEIINRYALKDKRIVVIKNEKNLGISLTRNKLISFAKGKYIAWQDADDISMRKRLEHQYKYMEENINVGICGGYLEFFNDEKILSLRTYPEKDSGLRNKIFRQSPVAQPGAMIRKGVLEKTGLFDINLPQAEDLDLSLRIGQHLEFANLQEKIIKYRMHNNSVTVRKLRENIECTLEVRKRAVKKYGYKMSFMDKIVYGITSVFKYVPPKITYLIFNLIRNK